MEFLSGAYIYIDELVGFLILLFCILSFFFPYGERFTGKVQKINMFGMDLSISVFTLLILFSAFLIFSDVIFPEMRFEKELLEAKIQINDLEKQRDFANKIDLTLLFTLDGTDEQDLPKPEDLICEYFFTTDAKMESTISRGITGKGRYKVIIQNVSKETHVRRFTVKDTVHNRQWQKVHFKPLEPEFLLAREL